MLQQQNPMAMNLPLSRCLYVFRLALVLWLAGLTGLPTCAEESGGDPALPGFDVLEYAVDGNTRLTDIEIERAVTPFLGFDKNLRDVENARAALERTYHDAGYLTALVSIPEQDVSGGVVTLSVIEGKVDRLRVKGADYHLSSDIKRKMPELAEGSVPYFPKVQRDLEALNRGPDLKATPVLKAGRFPGTVEVQMEVDDQLPLHGSFEFSNRQSPNTTPQRLSGIVRYDNLWQLGHSASLTVQTSPQNTEEVRTAAATYVVPAARGNAWVGYGVVSRSKFATLAGSPGLGLLGDSNIYGVRYAMPLPGYDGFFHSLSFGIDYKDVKQSVVVADSAELPTPITYSPLVLAYSANWYGNGGTTTLEATATHGLRGVLGNRDEEFEAKRSGASAGFFSLRTGVQHTETIRRWALSGKLETQIASGPLVSNEQYSAGGAESVRGYLEGERVGDVAWRWGFELRTPPVTVSQGTPLRLTGLAFYEGARLRILEPVALQPDRYLLRGTGVGLRLAAGGGLSLDLDWAQALDDADITRAGDTRVHARVLWSF